MRQWMYLLLLIVLMIVTAGCNGAHETDQLTYVVAIGIDKGENNKLTITYQLAIPRQIAGAGGGDSGGSGGSGSSGSDSGGGGAKKFANVTISAFSIAETRNQLKSIVALTPVFYHAKMIIFGESLAKSGLGDILGPLLRYREYRGSMYVAVAKGSAQEFLEKNQPAITGSTAKYYELMLQSDSQSGFFLSTSLHSFYEEMKGAGGAAYAAYIGINPSVKDEKLPQDTKEKLENYKEVPRVAGETNRIGGDAAEFLGAAIFNGDKMVGVLDSHQTRMVSIFLKHFDSGYTTIEDVQPEGEKKGISLRYKVSEPPEVKTKIADGKPIVHIHLKLEGELSGVDSGINYEAPEYREKLERKLSEVFTRDLRGLIFYLQECNSDVLSIGDYFRPKFKTLPEFIDFHWKEQFKDAQIDGDVQFKIRRTGLMWKTNPIVK